MASPSASYEHVVRQHEENTLNYYKRAHEGTQFDSKSHESLRDITISVLLQRTSQVFVSILDELLSGQVLTFGDFINLFLKEGRPIYVGLIIIVIAFSMYLIDITS